MARERELSRCRDRLDALSGSSLDSDSFRREAVAYLQPTIGFDRWCWPLADPETLVTSSGLAEHNFGPDVPRSLQLEYSTDEFAAKHLLARRARPVGSLRAETAGDLARSTRWNEVLGPAGIGDVAIVACRDAQGCWGWIELYRDSADPSFDEGDLGLLESVGPAIASWRCRQAGSAGHARPRPRSPPRQLDDRRPCVDRLVAVGATLCKLGDAAVRRVSDRSPRAPREHAGRACPRPGNGRTLGDDRGSAT